MPAYSNTNPPTALYQGDSGFSFDTETPVAGTAGTRFALGDVSGRFGHTFSAFVDFTTAPSAWQMDVQVSDAADIDADYVTIDSFKGLVNARADYGAVAGKWVRLKCVSNTGGVIDKAGFSR